MIRIFFAAILIFLGACGKASLYDRVQRNWHYMSAKDSLGNDFKKVSTADILSLTAHNFQYDIAQENIHASGTWVLQDSTLAFTYNPKPTDTDTTQRTVRYFKITQCTNSRLVFVEKGVTFTFSY